MNDDTKIGPFTDEMVERIANQVLETMRQSNTSAERAAEIFKQPEAIPSLIALGFRPKSIIGP